ncbi:MAG: alkaline phosphatase D family protein [Blastocatellia bacterium]|nr:alkaline phosphatase D family protein [Blastocatellia bacterium]
MHKIKTPVAKLQRREFLQSGTSAVMTAMLLPMAGWVKSDAMSFANDPFQLGIASGDPWPDGVVLWTRLAPNPLQGGGMPAQNVPVQWEVATDERMQNVVAKGRATARPEMGHSVHVEVRGLQPARWYWYRFTVDAGSSPIGRTRTAPASNAKNDRMNFAFVSCQHYETGYYTAYKHLAADDLELVFHLGDYIYEGGAANDRVRKHNSAEIKTIEDYRNRYALYKSDPLLQLAHANFPWAVVWDDHEVDNNYAGLVPEDKQTAEEFARRRAFAYQVYYEHMPLRRSVLKRGNNVQIYRHLSFGNLASAYLLDTRQYRTNQPCDDGNKPACPESLDPRQTLLGDEQERWLQRSLSQSKGRWNILAQQVMVGALDTAPGEPQTFPMDQWNGYAAARKRLLEFLRDRKPSNPVVLTGDIHSNWVNDLKPEFYRESSPVVATEFVGTSITSGGDGSDVRPTTAKVLSENPHIKFFNAQRGYVRCSLTPQRWQSDYRIVTEVSKPDAPVSTRASFVVESGRAGAHRV